MYMLNRIISLGLAVVICFFALPFSVFALEAEQEPMTSLTNYGDTWILMQDFWELAGSVALGKISDFVWPGDGSDMSILKASAWYCAAAESKTGSRLVHAFPETGHASLRSRSCQYCGLSWTDFLAEIVLSEDEFVANSDSNEASSENIVAGFSGVGLSGSTYQIPSFYGACNLLQMGYSSFLNCLKNLGIYNKVLVCAVNSVSPYHLHGLYFDPSGKLCVGYFANPSGTLSASVFGVYDIRSLEQFSPFTVVESTNGNYIFYSREYVEKWAYFNTRSCYFIDWSKSPYYGSFIDSGVTRYGIMLYCYSAYKGVIGTSSSACSIYSDGFLVSLGYYLERGSGSWDSSYVVTQPTGTDETSRPDALLQALEEYNKNHPYPDNSVPNFMIGALDADGNLRTEIDSNGVVIPQLYPPSVYDEQTLIFTEPVTGAQYLTTGWTYDYETRMYVLDVVPETFFIEDNEIRTIFLVYADDALYISYCDENMNTIAEDRFAYVTVASSSCTLNGHSYNVETTKEASCTSIGERRYTCTACGDQYVEEIPMNEHIPVHSVLNEATCTDPGLSVYTCATCGGQYTEKLDPLGHDWVSTSVVEPTYSLPPGTACPDCFGSDFTAALDEASGTYSCTCNGCGLVWSVAADVTNGYTVYSCSRCDKTKTEYSGESGDGLFTSIGNFFANGITWCTDKLAQLVDNLGSMIDTFNDYLDDVEQNSSAYPSFLNAAVGILPDDLMAVVWLGVIAFVVLAVIKIWFR